MKECCKAELLQAADEIQAMHPGEVKNSVVWLRARADRNWSREPTVGELGLCDPPQLGPQDYAEEHRARKHMDCFTAPNNCWVGADWECPHNPLKDKHVVTYKAEQWGLQHPLACRPNLLSCQVHLAMHEQQGAVRGKVLIGEGRAIVTLEDDENDLRFEFLSS